jgi:hypothetical protein
MSCAARLADRVTGASNKKEERRGYRSDIGIDGGLLIHGILPINERKGFTAPAQGDKDPCSFHGTDAYPLCQAREAMKKHGALISHGFGKRLTVNMSLERSGT